MSKPSNHAKEDDYFNFFLGDQQIPLSPIGHGASSETVLIELGIGGASRVTFDIPRNNGVAYNQEFALTDTVSFPDKKVKLTYSDSAGTYHPNPTGSRIKLDYQPWGEAYYEYLARGEFSGMINGQPFHGDFSLLWGIL